MFGYSPSRDSGHRIPGMAGCLAHSPCIATYIDIPQQSALYSSSDKLHTVQLYKALSILRLIHGICRLQNEDLSKRVKKLEAELDSLTKTRRPLELEISRLKAEVANKEAEAKLVRVGSYVTLLPLVQGQREIALNAVCP